MFYRVLLFVVCVSPALALGSVVSVTGNLTHVPTPSGTVDLINSTTPMQVWNELQGASASSTSAEAVNNPWTSQPPSAPTNLPGFVTGVFDSHRIVASAFDVYNGSIRFSGPIVAVMMNEADIVASDPTFAPPGLTVLTFFNGQSINAFALQSLGYFSVSNDTLTFHDVYGHPGPLGDCVDIRVLTAVPAPSVWALPVAVVAWSSRRRR